MKRILITLAGLGSVLPGAALGANIYVLSSGDPGTDAAAVAALTSRGHTVTVGTQYLTFDGTVNLSGFETVYLQANSNWIGGLMPTAGQQQLINFVSAGGRLVASEWVIYYSYTGGGKFELLGPIFPADSTFSYGTILSATLTQAMPNAQINAGLPASFTCTLTSFAGTETYATAKSGAFTYYTTSNSPTAAALAGWEIGAGTVFSFMSTCGPDQVGDANFGRLFSNVMGASSGCYANCDGVGSLTGNDFQCFLDKYVSGDTYANCDGVGGLTGNDFQCFLNKYVGGCH